MFPKELIYNPGFWNMPDEKRRVEIGKGYVELVGAYGTDDFAAEIARISYSQGKQGARKNNNAGLLNTLIRNQHTSPLEHPKMSFVIAGQLFVRSQLVRHRMANWNEESARYSEMEEIFWEPAPEEIRIQSEVNNQGSYGQLETEKACDAAGYFQMANEASYNYYQSLLNLGVPREQARAVLNQGLYTTWVWTIDLNNLMKTAFLRMDIHAQKEIRDFFHLAIYPYFRECFPIISEAFDRCILRGRRLTGDQIEVFKKIRHQLGQHSVRADEWLEAVIDASISSKMERNETRQLLGLPYVQ